MAQVELYSTLTHARTHTRTNAQILGKTLATERAALASIALLWVNTLKRAHDWATKKANKKEEEYEILGLVVASSYHNQW